MMKMTATGDSILLQGYPEEGYPGLEEIQAYIAKGEARFGNLETNITDWDCYASTYCGGSWMNTTPRILDQILGFGMNFLSYANNHTMDYGPDGMLETIDNLKVRDVAYAGAGANLEEASQAVYRTLPGGRVALIAVTASFDDTARAGHATKILPGRPGLNPLRKTKNVYVTPEHFQAIREVLENTELNGTIENSIRDGFTPPWPEGTLVIGQTRFIRREGKEEVVNVCNKKDLERIGKAITDAKLVADYVVVMVHDHANKGRDMSVPDDGAIEFAHFCIDKGVDAVFGGGTHQLKPLELYKGHPIFYTLGNFCFQSNMQEHQPADMLEKHGFEGMTDLEALNARMKGGTIGLHTQFYNFRSIIPYLEFEGNTLTKMELKPIELGFEKGRTWKGIPYPANERQTKEIYERLKELSEPYGTEMTLREDGIIEVKVS